MKWNIAATACCVLLLIIDVALLRQNRQLKAQLSAPPAGLEVQAGIEVPDLKGFDAAGKPLSVRYGQELSQGASSGVFACLQVLR